MSSKDAKIYERDGCWYCTTTVLSPKTNEERTIESQGFDSFEDAALFYAEQVKKYKEYKKLLSLKHELSYTNIKLKDYLVYWYHKVYVPQNDSKTAMVIGYSIYQFILPSISEQENIQLSAVTTGLLNRILDKCKEYCGYSGNGSHKALSDAFIYAYDNCFITSNPMASANKYYAETKAPAVIYSTDQLKTFLTYVSSSYRSIYLEVALALLCGLRTGEIRGLKFSDFDYKNRLVSIRRQFTTDVEINCSGESFSCKRMGGSVKRPKTQSSNRTLRINDVIFKLLDERKEVIREAKEKAINWNSQYDDFIAIGKNGNIVGDTTINAALRTISNRTGLPKITTHDLRHMAATILYEQCYKDAEGHLKAVKGVQGDNIGDILKNGLNERNPLYFSLLRISKYLGHKSPNTTFDIYIGQQEDKSELKRVANNVFTPISREVG